MTNDPFVVHGSDAKDQFTPLEAGVHQAALACIVYNPNQPGYQGSEAVNQCIFVWVTPRVKDEGGAPKQVRMTITMPENPMHERAKFRQLIESWIGQPLTSTQVENFNMRQMLGARCTLVTTVTTSAQGRKYAKVTSVARRTNDSCHAAGRRRGAYPQDTWSEDHHRRRRHDHRKPFRRHERGDRHERAGES